MTLWKLWLEWKQSDSQHSVRQLQFKCHWSPESVIQFLMTLNGSPCPGMMTSAVCSASWRLTSCTAVFILRFCQLSSSEQHSNKSPATRIVPAVVPLTWTLTSCPVWPGLGTTDTCGREETVFTSWTHEATEPCNSLSQKNYLYLYSLSCVYMYLYTTSILVLLIPLVLLVVERLLW